MDLIVSAVLLLSAPLSIAVYLLGIAYRPKLWKKYTYLLVLSLAAIAYAYKPYGSPDLERYFEQLAECAKRSLSEVFALYGDSLYLRSILFWVLAKLGLGQLLPALTALCVYGAAAMITNDTTSRQEADQYTLYCTAFWLCMLPFFVVINNVRNVTAFAIALMAVYADLVKKERNLFVYILYIVPCLIHPSAILLLALRLLVRFAGKGKLIIAFLTLFIPALIDFMYAKSDFFLRFGPVGRIINSAVGLAYGYKTGDRAGAWAQQVLNSGFQKVNRLVMMSLAILVILLIVVMQGFIRTQYKTYMDYLFLLNVAVLACNIFTTPQYWRFAAAANIAAAPLLALGLKRRKELPFYFRPILYLILLYPFMGLILQLWYSRYLVDYGQFLPQAMVTNIYTILWDIVRAIALH